MIVAVIDSCIIFGMPLCDTLLRAAEQNLYRIILSQKILEDATRNMVIKGRLKPDREQYYQQQILNAFPDCFVEAPPNLTESMTNATSDRHVTATAISRTRRGSKTSEALRGLAQRGATRSPAIPIIL